jgi:hypothetical protein
LATTTEGQLIKVYRDESQLATLQGIEQASLEYVPPGQHEYEFRYQVKNLLGMPKDAVEKRTLTVRALDESELSQHFDFPEIDLSTDKYGVYISYQDLGEFSKLDVTRSGESIIATSSQQEANAFLEHVRPDTHTYRFEFTNDMYRALEGYLYQHEEVTVEPVQPKIIDLDASPLDRGYQTDVTAVVKDAARCRADLLLNPPDGYERAGQSNIKQHEFEIGDGFDYFYRDTENWSWIEVLFEKPTGVHTGNYDIDLRLTCYDYFDTVKKVRTINLQTSPSISRDSISLSFARNQSGIYYAILRNTIWENFSCRMRIGDQENVELAETSVNINGHTSHEVNLSQYNRNVLHVTAFCESEDGENITRIETWQPD